MKISVLLLAGVIAMPSGTALSQGHSAAEASFRTTFAEVCFPEEDSPVAENYPAQSWQLEWTVEHSEEPQTATLYQFYCSSGAYNVQLVYYLEDSWNGLAPIAFAVPDFEVSYKNDDFEDEVEAVRVRGFTTLNMLTNAEFDPGTRTITNFARWRGLGDASSSGTWVFDAGRFVLKAYDVDASYDGEFNPERLIEYE